MPPIQWFDVSMFPMVPIVPMWPRATRPRGTGGTPVLHRTEHITIEIMVSFSRRWLLKVCAAVGGASTLAGWFPFLKLSSVNMLKQADERKATTKMKAKPHIAVIGAGAFGGWTALYLLRRDARNPRNLWTESALYEDGCPGD